MVYGLTNEGFVEKPIEVIDAEIAAAQRASPALGADWETDAESPGGQLNGVIAAQIAELWQLGGVVYRSRDPRLASFAGLDAVCGLTGTTRRAATKGSVTLTITLAAGVTLAAGAIAHVAGQPENRWVTSEAVTNSSGSTAQRDVPAAAELAGAYTANASTINVIATPVTGWLAVNNLADASPGAAAERDPVLRQRRDRELFFGGTSPVDAIRAALSRVPGVSVAEVAENPTNAYDGERPPHSIEAIVQGGTDLAVAKAIWGARAGGIELYSSAASPTVVEIVDVGGFTRFITFTRPSAVDAFAEVIVIVDPGMFPGDATLADAIANVTTGQRAGQTIRKSDLIVAARAVAGVIDCTGVRLGRSSTSRTDTNLIADSREVLKIAAGRVTVTRGFV